MTPETGLIVILLTIGLFCAVNLFFCLKLRGKLRGLDEQLAPSAWQALFERVAEETLRRYEVRMKSVESEWEDWYEKNSRIAKRLSGDAGGRPRKKDTLPDEIPVESVPPINDKGPVDLVALTRDAVSRGLMR